MKGLAKGSQSLSDIPEEDVAEFFEKLLEKYSHFGDEISGNINGVSPKINYPMYKKKNSDDVYFIFTIIMMMMIFIVGILLIYLSHIYH